MKATATARMVTLSLATSDWSSEIPTVMKKAQFDLAVDGGAA
jgi:hypothetical protein